MKSRHFKGVKNRNLGQSVKKLLRKTSLKIEFFIQEIGRKSVSVFGPLH